MSRTNLFRLVIPLLLVLLAVVAAFSLMRVLPAPAPDRVIVAITFNLQRPVGVQMRNGVELALAQDDYRAGDVIIELRVFDIAAEDDVSQREKHIQTAETISDDEMIIAVIGAPNTEYARDVIPIYNAAGLAVLSPAATWPGLTKPGYYPGEPGIYYPTGTRNFFRSIPADDIQARAAVQWLAAQDLRAVYLVTIADNVYSQGVAGIVEANAPDWGVQIVGAQSVHVGEAPSTVMDAIAGDIRQSGAQVVYYPTVYSDEAYEVLFALRARLPDMVFLSTDGLSGGYINGDNTPIDDVYATSLVPPLDQVESAANFAAQYQETYGEIPSPYTLTAYDAARAVIVAIEQASPPTRANVITTLHDLEQVTGSMGTWQFDEQGDITLSYVTVMQFTEGSWTSVDYVEVN